MDTHVGFPSPVDATTEHGVVLGRPNEFVDVALAAGRYFQDALPIVGRTEELQTLVNFIETPGTARVVVLVGRAGSGKTSLLAALAETLSQRNVTQAVRFAADVASVAAQHAPRLPKGPSVIVIDDAHRKPCTAALLHAAQHRPEVAFVLTTRPGGLSRLVALCAERGLSEADIRVLPEIGPLSTDDAERSARHVLDEEFGAHAKQLATISAGHPQLVSIAGRLVREKALHPVALEQPADFGARVLARGYETLLMRASVTPDQKLFGGVLGQVTDMLGIVAALAPVRTSDERFLQGAGELLGCRRRDLVSALRALETTGIIERSAPGARVVPTALADHALLRLLTAPLPLPGTLAERVSVIVRHFGIHALVPLFRNLGEMDGPSIPPGSASKFVAELFEYCRDALDVASTMDRCRLLSSLREVCIDEPAGMLELVEFALQLPPLTDTAPKSRVLLSETSVTNELSPILQRIALHRQHLPEAVDSLWALGRDDVRLQSPHPDHPMRVLREFASRAHTLPVGFHEALLDAVERWQMVPHAHDHQHSPLDVIDTFLAESDAPISDDALASRQRRLRTRALESLARAAGSSNRRAALAGVRGLEGVLTDMATHSSAGFPEADWRDGERLEVIEMLRKTATSAADPVVHFAVADVLRWAAHRTPNDTICIAAELALADVPDSSERRLYEALTQRPPAQRAGLDLDAPPSSRLLPETRNNEPRGAETARIVIDEWMAKGPLPAAFVQQTAEALDTLSLAGKSGSPRVLLQVLSLKHPEAAAKACEVIMQSPDGPLGPHVAALLHTLRESAPERAAGLVQNIVTGSNATLCASLAQAFPRWVDKPRNGDREALRALLGHPDGFVRRAALGVLRTLAKTAPHDAVALAVEVDLSEGAEAVETLFGALDGGKLFVGDALSVEEIVAFLSRLSAATNLEGHSTIRFLHFAGKRLPEETALLLIERIERLVGPGVLAIENFVALPSEGLGSILARLPESPEWVAILRRIRQLARSRSNVVRTQAARLFQAASKNYSPVAMDVLSEWLEAARAEELEAVSALLEEAPASLLFSHVNLVATLLRNSHALGGALFDTVQNALLPVAMGQGRMRGNGPQMTDAALRTQAREAAAKLAPRSPERRFFEAIVKHTETLIAEETAAEHDDLFDL
ncbi:MAG: AAA family ATPase [Polyangiaceae bacterium]|nr:AAA family ATPase [Polyangiaceae bacterium]